MLPCSFPPDSSVGEVETTSSQPRFLGCQRGFHGTGSRLPGGCLGWSCGGVGVGEVAGRTPRLPGRLPGQLPVASSPHGRGSGTLGKRSRAPFDVLERLPAVRVGRASPRVSMVALNTSALWLRSRGSWRGLPPTACLVGGAILSGKPRFTVAASRWWPGWRPRCPRRPP